MYIWKKRRNRNADSRRNCGIEGGICVKKYITQMLVFILILSSMVHVNTSNLSAQSNPYWGKAGKNITWTYNTRTKTMTFKGTGAFYKTEGTSDTLGYIGSWGCWTD